MKLLKKKSFYWVGGVFALLVVARVILPNIMLKRLNQYLENLSPLYAIHIRDLNLHIYRMAYSFGGVEGHLKNTTASFLEIKKVDVALAWREILNGRVVADVD